MSLRLFLDLGVSIICLSLLFGCESKPKWEDFKGGVHLVLEVESKGNSSLDEDNTIRISDILQGRVKQIGIKKMIIRMQGKRRIVIQLPPCNNPQRVIDLISKSFVLEFKLVDDKHSIEDALKGNIPPGDEILYNVTIDHETRRKTKIPYLLKKRTLLTGEYITDARVRIDSRYNDPYISVSFDPKGARLFEQITGQNIKKRLAFVLDKKVYSAPVIQDRITGGRAQITGRFTKDEAQDLAIVLMAGSYPANTSLSLLLIESRRW